MTTRNLKVAFGIIMSLLTITLSWHHNGSIKAQDQLPVDGFGINSPHVRLGIDEMPFALTTQQSMGISWAREELPWAIMEPTPNEYRWAFSFNDYQLDYADLLKELSQRNIEMVALPVYDPRYISGDPSNNYHVPETEFLIRWEAYIQAIVDEYGDQIDYWEIGNEMNSDLFWGKVVIEVPITLDNPNPDRNYPPEPEFYAEMLHLAHDVIKADDPNDVIILGGLVGMVTDNCETNPFVFLNGLQAAGGWDYFDVIGFHPYWGAHSPEEYISRGRAHNPQTGSCIPEETFTTNMIGEIRAVSTLGEQFGSKPIWITEIGWSQGWLDQIASYRHVDPNFIEADFVIRTIVPMLTEPDVEKIFWYTQVDDPNDNSGAFYLNQPAQHAMGTLSALLTNSQPLGQYQGGSDRGHSSDDDVYEYRFEQDGQEIIVLWKARGGETERDVVVQDIPTDVVYQYALDATDFSLEAGKPLLVNERQIVIPLTEHPTYLLTGPITLDKPSIIWHDASLGDQSEYPITLPGENVTLSFELWNTGSYTWDSWGNHERYGLIQIGGESFDLAEWYPVPDSVTPGTSIAWSLPIQAPQETGAYQTRWQMAYRDSLDQIVPFGPEISFLVTVVPEDMSPDLVDALNHFIQQLQQEASTNLAEFLNNLEAQIEGWLNDQLENLIPAELQCLLGMGMVFSQTAITSQLWRKWKKKDEHTH